MRSDSEGQEAGYALDEVADLDAKLDRLQTKLEALLAGEGVLISAICCADAVTTAVGIMADDLEHADRIIDDLLGGAKKTIRDNWVLLRAARIAGQ